MAICAPIIGLWYWCTDQYIVQRALAAPNETEARRGSIFAAFLKLFPPYLFIIPGLICYALAKSGRNAGLADALFGPHADPNASQGAFPLMVQHLLPSGLRGIVVAGLLSALMGSLAGVFNACSTLFTVDIYEKWRPKRDAVGDRSHGPHGHRRHGADRDGLDSRDQRRARSLQLPAVGAGLSGAAHLRRLLLRRVQQAAQRPGLSLGDDRGLHHGRLPADRGHAGEPGPGRLRARLCRRDRSSGS